MKTLAKHFGPAVGP